jgi:hypothetical protein
MFQPTLWTILVSLHTDRWQGLNRRSSPKPNAHVSVFRLPPTDHPEGIIVLYIHYFIQVTIHCRQWAAVIYYNIHVLYMYCTCQKCRASVVKTASSFCLDFLCAKTQPAADSWVYSNEKNLLKAPILSFPWSFPLCLYLAYKNCSSSCTKAALFNLCYDSWLPLIYSILL